MIKFIKLLFHRIEFRRKEKEFRKLMDISTEIMKEPIPRKDYADEQNKIRQAWEARNALAKKHDACNLHLKKTAFDSYEEYMATQHQRGLLSFLRNDNPYIQIDPNQLSTCRGAHELIGASNPYGHARGLFG